MDKLIDYLFFVGPGRGSVFRRSPSLKRSQSSPGGGIEPLTTWHKISRPVPTILCHFPQNTQDNELELPLDVAYFCQPEGPCVQLSEPKMHVFMLTDTETNIHTYGVCLSLPHLFDPLLKAQAPLSAVSKSTVWEVNDSESVCIQEWGVLSVCILARHPFIQFFVKCLKTLLHFVDHFGGKDLNWNAIIQAQINTCKNLQNGNSHPKHHIVQEVQEWIEKLVSLQAPSPSVNVLEVELEVDPASMVCYPPPNRLPLFELHVHKLFQRLEVCFVIDIYKLVLSEEKVILHSHDVAFVSECILTVIALLYPLQYLFPVIPLLPTSMPTAENLLMVPTPFFVGVCTSFMKKVNEVHRSETWVVDLDKKEMHSPSLPEKPPLEFPFSILQLQADIRRAMDKLESHGDTDNGTSSPESNNKNPTKDAPPPNNTNHTPTTIATNNQSSSLSFSIGHEVSTRDLGDDIDVMIRIAFIEFLFSAEILGLIERHLCVFRLFPRPVVTLRQVAFLSAYEKACSNTDKTFIKELIRSQCVEYFQEWSLNPPNYSFDEIRKGTKEVERLSDKQMYFIHRMGARTDQSCLYDTLPESDLYHEMLTFKASQASSFNVVTDDNVIDNDSDWEIVPEGEFYDGGSDENPPDSTFYHSDNTSYSRYPYVLSTTPHQLYESGGTDEGESDNCLDGRIRIRGDVDLQHSDDEVEVGFSSRGDSSNPHGVCGAGGEDTKMPSVTKSRKSGQTAAVHPTKETTKREVKGEYHPHPRYRRRKGSAKKQLRGDVPVTTTSTPKGTTPNSRLYANSAKTSSTSCPKDLMLTNRLLSDHPDSSGMGYSTQRRINEEIDVIPPSSSDEDDDLLSGYRRRRPRPLRRHDFDTPLLHVPPLSGSSSSLEFNPSAQETNKTAVSLSDGGVKNKVKEEDVDGPFSSNRSIGITTTAGMIQTSRTLENQIQELVTKITEGQGLPWPKPAHLKRLAGYEKTRVMLLRHLEVRLRVRQPDEFVMATEPQIAHVATTRAVFKGLQDLLKYLLLCVEEELQKDSEASIFSVFLILRLAFSIHLPPPKQKTAGTGLSFFSTLFGSDEAQQRTKVSPKATMEMQNVLGSSGKMVEECDGGSKGGVGEKSREEEEGRGEQESVGDKHRALASEQETSLKEDSVLTSLDENGKVVPQPSSPLVADRVDDKGSPKHSLEFTDPLSDVSHSCLDGSPVRTIGSASSAFTPIGLVAEDRFPRIQPVATPPTGQLHHQQSPDVPNGDLSDLKSPGGSATLSPARVSQNAKGSPLRKGRARSPSHQLLLELLESPRVYRPNDGDSQLAGCVFLYKELIRSLGSSKSFLMEKKFWSVLFMSTISTDRNQLGWNEKTTELYTRYNTLTSEDRHEFGLEEDNLLSIILHDLLVFMLMVGMDHEETTMLIHRFAARTRLATSEEKLLQQTLKYIEKNTSTEVDLSNLGLLTLYSEVHPTTSYIVHYGINVVAPVYKLQLTSEALILRRFPDESITSRLWNNHVAEVECNKDRSTVTVRYKDANGEYNHHFHTKQFTKVCESLMKLIPHLSD